MIPFKLLYELAYVGNVGIQELMTFYQRATPEQLDQLGVLLKKEKISKAIRLIEDVTGVKLQEGVAPYGDESKNIDKSKVAAQRAMDRQKKRKAETGRGDPTPRRDSKPKSEARQITESEVQSNQIMSSEYMKDLEEFLTRNFKMDEAPLQDLLYRERNAIQTSEHGTLYEWKDLARALYNATYDIDSPIPHTKYFIPIMEQMLPEIEKHYNMGIRYYTWPE